MTAVDLATRGWSFAWRAAAYLKRRSREAGPLWRGKTILRRYTAHYQRAQRAYGVHRQAPVASVYDVGVRVVQPGSDEFLPLPDDFISRVQRVAQPASCALDRTENCDFFPGVDRATLTERTANLPEVVAGQVITIKLRDPFSIDGVSELADPLLAALEQRVYGCHLIVDKLYIYRSPVSHQQPKASWLWHFDNHPREMLKVMVYLSDVDRESAPFEYLRDEAMRPRLGAPLAPLHSDSRVPSDEIERLVKAGWHCQRVTGPTGTVLVFDDNVLHRGTLAQARHRDVVVFQVRPAQFEALPRLDRRWTGTFGDLDFNRDPTVMAPIPRPARKVSAA